MIFGEREQAAAQVLVKELAIAEQHEVNVADFVPFHYRKNFFKISHIT